MALFKTPAKAGGAVKKAPAKAGGVTKKVGTAKAAPRRSSDDDEDDGDTGDGYAIATGWGGATQMAQQYSDFMSRLQMKEETKIIRFMDDEPFATVAMHWFDRGTGKKKQRQSVLCRGSKQCPLCAIGDSPKVSTMFNVVELTDGDPVHWNLECGVRLKKDIEAAAKHPKFGPLTKKFYTLTREGMKFNDTKYKLDVIRREDDIPELAEEFSLGELHVPEWEEIDALDRYTVDDAKKGSKSAKEMREIAAELSTNSYDDDDD